MPLRMVEVVLGADAAAFFEEPFEEVPIQGLWRVGLDGGAQLIRVLVDSDQAEMFLDVCLERYGDLDEFRCFVLDVGAALPRPADETVDDQTGENPEDKTLKRTRISREELRDDLLGAAETSANYLALIALSTIVVAIGLLRDNVAVVIGAMVIAPLLGPNMALSLATLLADAALAGGRSSPCS